MSEVKLTTNKTSYEKLEKEYKGFRAPAYKVVVKGKDIVKAGIGLESVTVQLSAESTADTASFSVVNAYNIIKRDFAWPDLLALGNTVEIYMGYIDKLEAIFFGYITNVEYDFSGGAPSVNITAMDISFFMMRNGLPQIWKNMKIVDVVKQVGRKYGITGFELTDNMKIHEQIVKDKDSDHEFLKKEAEDLGYEFFVVGKKLYFRSKSTTISPLMKLEWGKNLMSYKVEHDIADQVSKVIVRGIIDDTKDVVIVEIDNVTKIGSNSVTGSNIMKKLGEFVEVMQENVKDSDEAKEKAKARMDDISRKLVSGSGSCIGLPQIRAGRYIEIGGLGKRLDTIYRIVSATHTISGSGYQTSFNLEGNAV